MPSPLSDDLFFDSGLVGPEGPVNVPSSHDRYPDAGLITQPPSDIQHAVGGHIVTLGTTVQALKLEVKELKELVLALAQRCDSLDGECAAARVDVSALNAVNARLKRAFEQT